MEYFLSPPSSLVGAAPAKQVLTTVAGSVAFETVVGQAFSLDPTRPPAGLVFLDFTNSPGNSSRVLLSLQECSATCTTLTTARISRGADGLRAYSAAFDAPAATLVERGNRIRLVVEQQGGPQDASVVLGTGGSTPSEVDVPGLAAPAAP